MSKNPALTPFTSIEVFIRDLRADSDFVAQMKTAIKYVGFEPMFDKVVLFTLSRVWINLKRENEPIADGFLVDLEKKQESATSTKAFLESVLKWMERDKSARRRILADLAVLLELQEKFPKSKVAEIVPMIAPKFAASYAAKTAAMQHNHLFSPAPDDTLPD